jgi:D-alanyl-D-alanine carboxypeptidase
MKKENTFFLLALLTLFFLAFLANGSFKNFDSSNIFYFLKASEIDLIKPLTKDKINDLYLNSNNFLSIFVDLEDGKEVLLSQKKSDEVIPIASLSKLMTAVVALENYGLEDLVKISSSAVSTFSTAGDLKIGEEITVRDLLYVMLIESSNDAAEAFAEKIGRSKFLLKMNEKAKELGMKNTKFINPSGLDVFEDASESVLKETNTSTPEDLKNLTKHILKNQVLITRILSISETELESQSGVMHKLENTNILLEESPVYLWGKTGYTKEANGCIILISKDYSKVNPGEEYVINVITGADDRFREARKLEAWLKDSFIW